MSFLDFSNFFFAFLAIVFGLQRFSLDLLTFLDSEYFFLFSEGLFKFDFRSSDTQFNKAISSSIVLFRYKSST